MNVFLNYLPGLLLAAVITLIAYLLAPYIPGFNAVLLGLVIGVLVGNVVKLPSSFSKGVGFSSSKVLEASIVLLAFGINFSELNQLGYQTLLIVAIALFLVLFSIIRLSKLMGCPGSSGLLIGFGTAICGSSAIAAAAPAVKGNKEDIGISLAVVNLIGGIGMLLYPFVFKQLESSNEIAALFIGGTLHSVGNVAGAGYAINEHVGNLAISVKMIRVALLAPTVIVFTILMRKSSANESKTKFSLPTYLWLFIGVTLLVTFVDLPEIASESIHDLSKLLLTLAMVAIGIKTSLKSLYSSGKMAIKYGVVVFLVQIIIYGILLSVSSFIV